MDSYSLAHLSNAALLHDLTTFVGEDRRTTAMLLAHIAEVDARQLYRGMGCSSMHSYCVGALHLSDDAAYKRIQAARAARQVPALFVAVAEGRLHLTAVCLLAPHLTSENAEELIEAATHRRKAEIEAWLVRRFEVVRDAAPVRPIIRAIPGEQLAPAQVEDTQLRLTRVDGALTLPLPEVDGDAGGELAPAQVGEGRPELAPAQVGADSIPERFLLRLAISKSTHDKLRRAQELLSHAVPGGDVAQVLDRALDALIEDVEARRFGARKRSGEPHPARPARLERKSQVRASTKPHALQKPRAPQGPDELQTRPSRPRYIPASVRRAVWERDRAQCTFVSPNGSRCEARHFLEFDHVRPVARGGKATVEGLRLRCQAHNQYEAERVFGEEFMQRKRQKARRVAAERRGRVERGGG